MALRLDEKNGISEHLSTTRRPLPPFEVRSEIKLQDTPIALAPGYITIINQDGDRAAAAFRELLHQNHVSHHANQNAAQHLRAFELAESVTPESLLSYRSLRHALRAKGVPQTEIPRLLQDTGANPETSPKELSRGALQYAAIAASLYGKARAILFDRPFLGSDPAWVEKIARLMLQVGEANARMMLVTNPTSIPQVWNNTHRLIVAESPVLPPRPLVAFGLDTQANQQFQANPLFVQETSNREQRSHLGGNAGYNQLAFESMQAVRRERKTEEEYEPLEFPAPAGTDDGPTIHTKQARDIHGRFESLRKKLRAPHSGGITLPLSKTEQNLPLTEEYWRTIYFRLLGIFLLVILSALLLH